MDLAELGIKASTQGVTQSAAELDKLSVSAGRTQESLGGFVGKSNEVGTATGVMNRQLSGVGALFAGMGPMILGAVTALAGFAAAAISLDAFVSATVEAEHNQAQLAAALKSTGGASGQTIESLNKYAEKLQEMTTYEDDAINKAQSLLLTFTKIGGETFPQATKAVLDLATRMGGDLQGASLQVGKALNDPIQGITALSRAGIQFTEDQKEMIKGFVESNQLIKAQAIILQELETQFGGSAEAARNTLGGAIQALKNAFGNLFEVSGPGVKSLQEGINSLARAMSTDAFKDFANTIGTVLFAALELAVKGFNLLVQGISSFWAYAGPTIKEFGSIMYQLGSVIIPAVGNAFKVLWDTVSPVITGILEAWRSVYDTIKEVIGIQDQVKTPETPTATTEAATVPSPAATNEAATTLNNALVDGGQTASASMSKGLTNAGETVADTAQQAHEIGAKTLASSFGVGADKVADGVTTSASTGGDIIGKAIEANATIMAAKFEGTGRNIYDLWNNWGNAFIDGFGTTIGELLIDFQRAQTAQLQAQAEQLRAQAELFRAQAAVQERILNLARIDQFTAAAGGGSGGSSGGGSSGGGGSLSFGGGKDNGGITTDSGIGNDSFGGGNGGGRNKRGGNYDVSTPDRNTGGGGEKITKLNERGNIQLTINNQTNPKDTLDNLGTATGQRVIFNVMASNRHAIKNLLGVRG